MSDDATITRLPLDQKAWREGYIAGRFCSTGGANPYPIGSFEAQSWLMALAAGRTKPLRLVR
jgi:hypothetical protein